MVWKPINTGISGWLCRIANVYAASGLRVDDGSGEAFNPLPVG